jgi:HSP20 family protein
MERRVKEESTESGASFIPPADIVETGEEWLVIMDMPGVEQKSLSLDMTDGVLTVAGHSAETLPAGAVFVRKERASGHFQRKFSLEDNKVDVTRVTAAMKDGVLRVRLPKAGPAKSHRIEVHQDQ